MFTRLFKIIAELYMYVEPSSTQFREGDVSEGGLIKTPAPGEVFSSLVLLRFYRAGACRQRNISLPERHLKEHIIQTP